MGDPASRSEDCAFFGACSVQFTPTVQHCSMATLIGLSLSVKLMQTLPSRFKVRPSGMSDGISEWQKRLKGNVRPASPPPDCGQGDKRLQQQMQQGCQKLFTHTWE